MGHSSRGDYASESSQKRSLGQASQSLLPGGPSCDTVLAISMADPVRTRYFESLAFAGDASMRHSLLLLTLFCAILAAPSLSFAQSSPSPLPDSGDTTTLQPDSGNDSSVAPAQQKVLAGGSAVSSELDASKTVTGAVTTGIEAGDTLGKAVTEITQDAVLPRDYNGVRSGSSWLPDAGPISTTKMFSAFSALSTGTAVAADGYGFGEAMHDGAYFEAGKRAIGLTTDVVGIEVPGVSGIGSIACDIMTAVDCAASGDWLTAGTYGSAALAKAATCTIGATLGAPLGQAAAGKGCDIGVTATETAIAIGRPALKRPIFATLRAASEVRDWVAGGDDQSYGLGWVPKPLTPIEQQALTDDDESDFKSEQRNSIAAVRGPPVSSTTMQGVRSTPSLLQGTYDFAICIPPNFQTCDYHQRDSHRQCFCHFVPGGRVE